jgi:quercetin dioxygenase-like cupin family protein
MHPWLVTLGAPTRQARKLETHAFQEFVFVLNGEVELTAKQNQSVVTRLSPGDSCFLDSSMPHSFAAASVSPYDSPHAHILVVRSESSRESGK